ncbi:MAG: PHP domain-containing protein [Clostridiales bacterium]|nr:PHP domain-containing protein [Clostridiales bacterium]
MIDLHIHSVYSDGTYTVREVLEEAKKNHVTLLSITDHNTVGAYEELKGINTEETYDIKTISGIEINCMYDNAKIEVLGYGMTDFEGIQQWCDDHFSKEKDRAFRNQEYARLFEVLTNNNIRNDLPEIWDPQLGLPHTAIYNGIRKHDDNQAFMRKEEWNSFDLFFRTATTNRDSIFFIEYSDMVPSAKEASETIKKAGGMVFLAHVYQYGLSHHIEFTKSMLKDGIINGAEVYHSTFTQEQSHTLIDYCLKNHLPMSGGSDSHGEKGRVRKIGKGYGNLHIPMDLIENWVTKFL